MAVFGSDVDRPLYGRGPSAGLRFTAYAILSVALMYYDQHGHWVQRLHYALDAAAYPVQVAVSSPRAAWNWVAQIFQTRDALRTENKRLHDQVLALEMSVVRQDALEQENGSGVLGQVARVGPWSAEVILVTDPEHAIPVEVIRNSLRSIAVGSGNTGELLLPYLAVNSDVKSGDLMVSSGLGGVFPSGLPVARITGVRREANQLLAQVRAQPLAHVERDREVVLLQIEPSSPAAPAPTPPIAPEAAPTPKPAPKIAVPDE
jgi:rod shape-determining protein MreC